MTINPAIPLAVMATRSADSDKTKPSKSYGAVLQAARKSLGLTRKQLEAKSGIDNMTIMRNELGYDERSVKASIRIREALIKLGAEVPSVVTGDDDVPPTDTQPVTTKLSAEADRVRWNIVRFREALTLDPTAASYACKIPLRSWLRFEAGDDEPSGVELSRIAKTFNCSIDDLVNLDEEDPLPELRLSPEDDQAARFYKLVGDFATPAEREMVEKLAVTLRARAKAEYEAQQAAQRKAQKGDKPKRK